MNELMVQSLIKIFAILSNRIEARLRKLTDLYVDQILAEHLPERVLSVYRIRYKHHLRNIEKQKFSYNIDNICEDINKEFSKKQRFILLTTLIEFAIFVQKNDIIGNDKNEMAQNIQSISDALRISRESLHNCKNFIANKIYDLTIQNKVVYIMAENPGISESKFMKVEGLRGYFVFVYFDDAQEILFRYYGDNSIVFNSNIIFPRKIYTMECGSVFELNDVPIIYYNDIITLIRNIDESQRVSLSLKNVNFTYRHSKYGLKNINLKATSGQFIGVLGGSGVGKSTLFNIINGTYDPQSGEVCVNGNSFKSNKREIQQLIGYVPQDDSLFENLTVYENLYYTASLSLGNLNEQELKDLVDKKLNEFGLNGIRDNRVGSALKRNISGGQRKRLNIVSEIIREPKILLVDEPTSGLSTVDSLKVMDLLKEQTLRGRLVVVNIHQPSTEIYRLFDMVLILDQGGYMDFYGNPLEAIKYFKQQSNRVDFENVECEICGNIKSNEIFEIIESKQVDEEGNYTDNRKNSSEIWSHRFLSQNTVFEDPVTPLPKQNIFIANTVKQFSVFFKRFLFSKCRDTEFAILSFVAPLLLSIGIAFFSKYYTPSEIEGYKYVFYENINIPIFFFTSIIACVFIGMIISSDTILKEAGINARESNLFLSKTAYYNSKVVFFFILSILQSLIFSIISVLMLRIKGMFFQIEAIMLIMCLLGNIIGLIISSVFKSLSAVYLVVPFLVIPLIVLSGLTIPYNKMHHAIANPQNVPLIGCLSPSMWGLEALIVDQYCDNAYEKYYFDIDFDESNSRLKSQYLIPKLFELTSKLTTEQDENVSLHLKRQIINGLGVLEPSLNTQNIFKISEKSITSEINIVENYLTRKQQYYQELYSNSIRSRDSLTTILIGRLGSTKKLLEFKRLYVNKGSEKVCLARENLIAYQIIEDEMVQIVDPIFLSPINKYGRAHFLAPHKNIGNYSFKTFNFNLVVLIGFMILAYLVLISDFVKRVLKIK